MTTAPGIDTTGIDIEGAKKAYYAVIDLVDRAVNDPARDWTSRFADVAVEPALSALLDDLILMAEHHVRAVGHTGYVATISHVSSNEVKLDVCLDSAGVDIIDEGGHSLKAGGPTRHPQKAKVTRRSNGSWIIAEISSNVRKTC